MPTQELGNRAGVLIITVRDSGTVDKFRLPLITGLTTERPSAPSTETNFVDERLDPPLIRYGEPPAGTLSCTYLANASEAVAAINRLEASNDTATFEWFTNPVTIVDEGGTNKEVEVAAPTGNDNKSTATVGGSAKANLLSARLNRTGRFLVVGTQAFGISRIVDADNAEVYLRGPVAGGICTPSEELGKIASDVAATEGYSIVTPCEIISMEANVVSGGQPERVGQLHGADA